MFATDKPPLEEAYLEHYGVKGMKWGQRRHVPDASGVSRAQARTEKRTINRQSGRNLQDFGRSSARDRDQAIVQARRGRIDAERKYSDVKRDLKGRRGELGKNAVRVQLAKAKAERYETIFKSEQMTSGEKVVNDLLNFVDDMTGTPRRRYYQPS